MENPTDPQQIIVNIQIDTNSSKANTLSYVKVFLQKTRPEEADSLANTFSQNYDKALQGHEKDDPTDLARLYRLITEFKPALASILKPGKEFDSLCDLVAHQFNVTLDRIRRQINEGKAQKKPMAAGQPRKDQIPHLRYYCTVCLQSFEIPPDAQKGLLNSDERIPLPQHCNKEMVLKIGEPDDNTMIKDPKKAAKIEIYPAEALMQHISSADSGAEYLKLISVGIDVGSSTSHLVFSRLMLKREQSFLNMSNRFELAAREIIYEGNILFTPLLDSTTIDIEAVIKFFKEEYVKANLVPEQIDTGAVIVTGETAKKKNAEEIVRRLASQSGKFVSATAGPNYESVLAAMGSGIVDLSRKNQNTVLNVDVGGGSSKLAIASNGLILSTSSISVGGRLLGIDRNFKIWRVDEPTKIVMQALNMGYRIGDIIPEKDVRAIARTYAELLIEVMFQPTTSALAKKLMLTGDLDFSVPVDEVSFSGGVAELIYAIQDQQNRDQQLLANQNTIPYNDIGWYMANEILQLIKTKKIRMIEPKYKIRATVIGAGAHSLSVSGSTCYLDPSIQLPLDNIPIVSISLNFTEILVGGDLSAQKFKEKVAIALMNYNLVEGVDNFALFFNDINIRANLSVFAKALELALPTSFAKNKLVVIILGFDAAKMIGLTIKKETSLRKNLLCLDELFLEDGDWIDIGQPLSGNQTFPITIKSLVFNQSTHKESGHTGVKQTPPQSKKAPFTPKHESTQNQPNLTRIAHAFKAFQATHEDYENLLILTHEGTIEFTTDTQFWSPSNAQNLFHAWHQHEPAFFLNEIRFPILSWEELQFAAKNPKGNEIIVGSKTKTNHYVVMKLDAGTKWSPNIASYAVKILNQWAWDLI